jgi:hypothetical protein
MAGTFAILIWIGLYVALRRGKMVNLAWMSMPVFDRRDRPRYYWFSIAVVAGLSAFCAYLAIWAPP